MPLDRTQLTDRSPDDFATINDINNVYAAVNNLKANAVDRNVPDLEVMPNSTTANDRGAKFWLTATNWVRFWWDNTAAVFKVTDQADALQKISFANGTAASHGITKAQLDAAINALQLEVTGAIKLYAGTAAPTGYLLCDGTAVSRTAYAALFAVLSTRFGAGDGTTFNLPDLRGRVPVGLDNMGGVAANRLTSASLNGGNASTLGGVGGEETHQLTITELPKFTVNYQKPTTQSGASGNDNQYWRAATTPTASSEVGGDTPHSNTQPWMALNYIIKI